MVRYFTLTLGLLALTFFYPVIAQENLINRVFNNPEDTAIERKLVELALEGPRYKSAGGQIRLNELQLRNARNSWLNYFAISANYNSLNSKQTPQNTIVYPAYFMSLTIPLGIFFSTGTQVKSAKASLALSQTTREQTERTIKAEILSKYSEYKVAKALLEMQTVMINDMFVKVSQTEEDFKKGLITVDTYIASQKASNDELTKILDLKLQEELLRIEIESMIGVPLESILKPADISREAIGGPNP